MRRRTLSLPTLALIAGTRVALGLGLGFLLGERLKSDRREQCGWALIGVGALSTIPLALDVFYSPEAERPPSLSYRRSVSSKTRRPRMARNAARNGQ